MKRKREREREGARRSLLSGLAVDYGGGDRVCVLVLRTCAPYCTLHTQVAGMRIRKAFPTR